MEREVIKLEYDDIMDFWDALFFDNSSTELNGDIYTRVAKINTSEYCDGECFEYIVERESDMKYFKYSWWEGGSSGYQFSYGDNTLTEVFPKQVITVTYE